MPCADGARLFAVVRIIPDYFATQAHLNSPLGEISGPANHFSPQETEDMTEPGTSIDRR
jgi:hypothetical protein